MGTITLVKKISNVKHITILKMFLDKWLLLYLSIFFSLYSIAKETSSALLSPSIKLENIIFGSIIPCI